MTVHEQQCSATNIFAADVLTLLLRNATIILLMSTYVFEAAPRTQTYGRQHTECLGRPKTQVAAGCKFASACGKHQSKTG